MTAIFSASDDARMLWTARLGYGTKTTWSTTRWHGKFEIETGLFQAFADVPPFVRDDLGPSDGLPIICPEHRRKLIVQLEDVNRYDNTVIELAAVQDRATELVLKTYANEEELDAILEAYDNITVTVASLHPDATMPNTNAVALKIATRNGVVDRPRYDALMAHARSCIRPAYDYICAKLQSPEYHDEMEKFKAMAYFHPIKAKERQPSEADLAPLADLAWLRNEPAVMQQLLAELPAYLITVREVNALPDGTTAWWAARYKELMANDNPRNSATAIRTWIKVAYYVLVQLQSSALSERVFSIIKRLFGVDQASTYADLVDLAVRQNMENTRLNQEMAKGK